MPNSILDPQKPLLKSYFSNSYQKVYIDSFQSHKYYLNQVPDYWDINSSHESALFVMQRYKKENRAISKEDFQTLFLSKLNLNNFKENKDILDKIYQDVSKIYAVLTKLNELNLGYSIDLTGVAVRDFINNKPIKDLDIMLSIYDSEDNKKILKKMNDVFFLKKHFKPESILYYINNVTSESSYDDFVERKQNLMILCFQDLLCEKFTFNSDTRRQEMATQNQYHENILKNNRLLGIYELNQEKMKLNYPVEILLTDFKKYGFIQEFDFDICKASFSLINHTYRTEFPQSSLELISRFTAELGFWADIHNKKITMNVDHMSNWSIEHSIKTHLPRILQKYPDYTLNIISSEKYHNNAKYAQYIFLENKIAFKEDNQKKLKI